jgi:pimeloyl-ACP methyl ester carboxylesterase
MFCPNCGEEFSWDVMVCPTCDVDTVDRLPGPVEPFVLPGPGHLLHLQNASGMAEGLAASFARHSLGVAA